jgi:hypothetical protein
MTRPCGRVLDNFPTIIGRLAGMVDRFTTTLDCVDVTYIGDQLLDQLPAPTQLGTYPVSAENRVTPLISAFAAGQPEQQSVGAEDSVTAADQRLATSRRPRSQPQPRPA